MKIFNKTLNYAACGVVILSQVVTFSSCKNEEDDLFSSSAAERLMQAEKDYTKRLISSEGGWLMELYPTNDILEPDDDYLNQGIGYLVLQKFNTDNSVLVGMNNDESGNKYIEDSSAWQIISDNGPVLTYNTYNEVMHTFSDPAGNGDIGTGIGGDYEFVVVSLEENAQFAMLKGKKRGTYNRLTRLPAGTNFEEYLEDVKNFTVNTFGESVPNYVVMDLDGAKYKLEGINEPICNIYPYDGDAIADQSFWPFLISKRDGSYFLRFRDKVEFGKDVQGEQEFRFDESLPGFVGVTNAENKITGPTKEDITSIFVRSIQKGGSWKINKTDGEGALGKAITAMFDGMQEFNKSYSINTISFAPNSDQISLKINFNQGRSKVTLDYYFDVNLEGTNVTLTYDQAKNTTAEKYLTNVPAIKEFIDMISGKSLTAMPMSAGAFSLSKIKLGEDEHNCMQLEY